MTTTWIKLFIGVLCFGAWLALVLFKVPGCDDLIASIKLALLGLGAYHLNDRTNLPPPSSGQGGYARAGFLAFIAAGMLSLAGCAGLEQGVTGYESAAYAGIKAANDNTIRVWVAAACGTPFSAAIRNPEIIPALKALCLPAGASSSPAALLDAVQLSLPAAK